jgi:hypothetical protein
MQLASGYTLGEQNNAVMEITFIAMKNQCSFFY